MKNKKSLFGFTLIELVVVIGIMGFLTVLIFTSFNNARAQSRDQRRISDMAVIQLALEQYFNCNGQYPISIASLSNTTVKCPTKFLPIVPTPPTPPTGGIYNYVPLSANTGDHTICISYQLWVTLERNNGTAISAKKGFNSLAAQPFTNGTLECTGSTGTKIDASLSNLTYDVMP